tara:strand:- start:16 stop:294 length:279 start_codon:yes stop_codon:yes gene_type:complete
MARSRRKIPKCGHTTATSEKFDKKHNHRKQRKANRDKIKTLKNINDVNELEEFLDEEEFLFEDEKESSDPWLMRKDGKQYFNPDEYPELMRK